MAAVVSSAASDGGISSDAILKGIKQLSSDELIVKLMENGVRTGPVTGTTRPLFERKLLRIMTGETTAIAQENENLTEPDKEKAENDVASSSIKEKIFYGVQIPIEARANENILVFQDKKEALRLVKSYPGSRFKPFPTRDEGLVFSQQNPDQVPPSPKPDGKPVTEGSAYRGPKPQELVRLRKAIEAADKATVLGLIWANPRYLISSGDTPTILHEGFRYNALHTCAQKNQAEICRALVETLQKPAFIQLLYPDDTENTRMQRIHFITDLYLNTPDKGNNETPLHFACKFAFPEVVQVLVSQPQTDKLRRNRYNETPADQVCQRARNPSQELKDKIQELLQDQYYVPLLRSDDTCHIAAEPWSPERLTDAQTDNSPHKPVQIPLQVKAVAGPMSPVLAERFRKHWVTSPSPKPVDRRKFAEIKRSDYEKGLERIGRMLAREMRISWSEYWAFLDSFIDLSSPEGLLKLENYLCTQAHKLDPQITSIEQQLAQLNLSDSGEDSGIENHRDPHTPPQPKRTLQHKLPSLRSPLPTTLTFYTTKTPSTVTTQTTTDSAVTKPVISKSDTDITTTQIKSDTQTKLIKSPILKLPENYGKTLGGKDATVKSNMSESQNEIDSSMVQDSSIGSAETTLLNNDASSCNSANTTSTCDESDNNSNKQPVDIKCDDTPNSIDAGELLTNHRVDAMTTQGINFSDVKKALDLVETSSSSTMQVRNRRNSECSDASTTSDMSTDSYHTCYSRTAWSDDEGDEEEDDDDDDDFVDFDELEELNGSPWLHRYFLHGSEPTKDDVDVLRAIETTPVSPDDYPHVSKWKDALLSYSEEDRNRFQSPNRRSRTPSGPTLTKPGAISAEEQNIRANLLHRFTEA